MAQTINADDGVISGSTGLKFTADTTSSLALQTNGTTKVTIDSNGSVTIPNATQQSLTNGALLLTGASGAIIIDNYGHKRISWNDGGGNFNIRAGHYQASTGTTYVAEGSTNGGAASITMNSDGTNGVISFNVADIGVGGTTVTWGSTITFNTTGLGTSTGPSSGTNYIRYAASNTGGSFQFGIDNSGGTNFFGSTAYGRAIFSDGAYPVGIFTNSTLKMLVDSSGTVYVGAGTTGVSRIVIGTGGTALTEYYAAETNPRFSLGRDVYASGQAGIAFGDTSNTFAVGGAAIAIPATRTLAFATSNGTALTERMRIDSAGNVGIGTTSPSSYGLLTVLSTTAGSAKINIMDNSAGSAAPLLQFGMNHSNGFNTADAARIWTTATASNIASLNFAAYNTAAPSTAQMVLNAGNVGVGVSPSYKLHVYGAGSTANNPSTSASTGATIAVQDSSSSPGNGGMIQFGTSQGYFAGIKGYITNGTTNSIGDLIFATRTAVADATLTERMRINAAGSSVFSGLIYHTAATAVTAAGSTQGTATALTSEINNVTAGQVALGTTGVILPTPAAAGLRIFVRNGSASNSMKVYPHSSGNISGVGVNTAIDLDYGVVLEFIAFDTTNWYLPSSVLA